VNNLPRDKQIQVIAALTEGMSIRATERLTGIHRDTIMRLPTPTEPSPARQRPRCIAAPQPGGDASGAEVAGDTIMKMRIAMLAVCSGLLLCGGLVTASTSAFAGETAKKTTGKAGFIYGQRVGFMWQGMEGLRKVGSGATGKHAISDQASAGNRSKGRAGRTDTGNGKRPNPHGGSQ
jgi:hypothetical protein